MKLQKIFITILLAFSCYSCGNTTDWEEEKIKHVCELVSMDVEDALQYQPSDIGTKTAWQIFDLIEPLKNKEISPFNYFKDKIGEKIVFIDRFDAKEKRGIFKNKTYIVELDNKNDARKINLDHKVTLFCEIKDIHKKKIYLDGCLFEQKLIEQNKQQLEDFVIGVLSGEIDVDSSLRKRYLEYYYRHDHLSEDSVCLDNPRSWACELEWLQLKVNPEAIKDINRKVSEHLQT